MSGEALGLVPDWILTRRDLTALEQWWLARAYAEEDLLYDPAKPEEGTAFRAPAAFVDTMVGLPRPLRVTAENRLMRRGLLRIVPSDVIPSGELRTESGRFEDAPAYLIFPKGHR